jgi:hypothetical protein
MSCGHKFPLISCVIEFSARVIVTKLSCLFLALSSILSRPLFIFDYFSSCCVSSAWLLGSPFIDRSRVLSPSIATPLPPDVSLNPTAHSIHSPPCPKTPLLPFPQHQLSILWPPAPPPQRTSECNGSARSGLQGKQTSRLRLQSPKIHFVVEYWTQ